jgi:3-keto-disaccharide hydrolase
MHASKIAGWLLALTSATEWSFEKDSLGQQPSGFEFLTTAKAPAGKWEVKVDGDNRVLAQLDADTSARARFTMAIAKDSSFKDLTLSVRGKPVAGKVDQSVGLVWRLKDVDNYYLVRTNALEQNVVLYRVVGGKRRELGGKDYAALKAGEWQTIKVEQKGSAIKVFLGQEKIIEAEDTTFPDAGRVGVWVKADSVTYFDDLTVEEHK